MSASSFASAFSRALRRRAPLDETHVDLHDLAEDAQVEAVELLDAEAHGVEEPAHQGRRRGARVGQRAVEHHPVVREHALGDRLDQGALRAEVVEDGGARDARELRDLGHRDGLEAAAREQGARGLQDPLALAERAGAGAGQDLGHGLESNPRLDSSPAQIRAAARQAGGRRLGRDGDGLFVVAAGACDQLVRACPAALPGS